MITIFSYLFMVISYFLTGLCISIFVKPRYGIKSIILFPTLIFIVSQGILLSFRHTLVELSVLKLITAVVVTLIGTVCFFQGKLLVKLLAFMISIIIACVSEMVSVTFLIALIDDFLMKAKGDIHLYFLAQGIYLSVHIAIIGMIAYFATRKRGKFKIEQIRMFVLFPFTQMPYFVFYYKIIQKELSQWAGLLWVLIAFYAATNILIYHEINELSRKVRLEERIRNYENQMRMQMKCYESLAEYHQDLRNLRHDFNNQMQVIHLLIRQGKVEEAVKLLEMSAKEIGRLERA